MSRPGRTALRIAGLACAALVPVELGWVPWLRYAWGMNLWQYLPAWVATLLAIGVLGLTWAPVRAALLRQAARLRPAGRWVVPAAALVVAVLLWLVRERRLYADSFILLVVSGSGLEFVFPDVGASYLFRVAHRLGSALGIPTQAVVQALVCLAGALAVVAFAGAARWLAPTRGRAAAVALLVLGGGITRVLAGHVEVYAFVVACAGAYLWAALAHLRGRSGLVLPALALGAGIWMHLSFLFLVPTLLPLVWHTTPGGSLGVRCRRLMLAGSVTAAPMLAFVAIMLIFGFTADLARAWQTMLELSGLVPSPTGYETFLRLPLRDAGPGTLYVILSGPHLKYLANAFFLLAPAALPILALWLVWRPRRLIETPEARFLAVACASMAVYTIILRPSWGPYDWDLFSLTAVCLAALAGHVLATALDDETFGHASVLLIGTTLLVVTLPFLAIGIALRHPAGPFGQPMTLPEGDESPPDAVQRGLGPWL